MIDLEKLRKVSECCLTDEAYCEDCPYYRDSLTDCQRKFRNDVLELLKEQDAKLVIQDRQCEVEPNVWKRKGFCPKCHQTVEWLLNRSYCGFCGQAVKWND